MFFSILTKYFPVWDVSSLPLQTLQNIFFYINNNNKKALKQSNPPPKPKFQPKVIRDSNPECQINPDPDPGVCRICPKMWMHYLIGVSHFANYRTSRPFIVWEKC